MMNKTTDTAMADNFKSWEDMTVLEQYQCQYWDMYKDAYGFRPRGIDTSSWTEQDFEKEFEYLAEVIRREDEVRRADQHRAIVRFSERIERTILSGAKDRETALRWIHEADGSNSDEEYLAYLNGLPYGYFKSTDSVN
jgi:hypothetical protein